MGWLVKTFLISEQYYVNNMHIQCTYKCVGCFWTRKWFYLCISVAMVLCNTLCSPSPTPSLLPSLSPPPPPLSLSLTLSLSLSLSLSLPPSHTGIMYWSPIHPSLLTHTTHLLTVTGLVCATHKENCTECSQLEFCNRVHVSTLYVYLFSGYTGKLYWEGRGGTNSSIFESIYHLYCYIIVHVE